MKSKGITPMVDVALLRCVFYCSFYWLGAFAPQVFWGNRGKILKALMYMAPRDGLEPPTQ